MSSGIFALTLASPAVATEEEGHEVLEVHAQISGERPAPILLRAVASTTAAEYLKTRQGGDHVLACGELIIERETDQAILQSWSISAALPEQYLNEVTLVGRLTNEPRGSGSAKSVSRTVAVNRYANETQLTSFFQVRGYGYARDKLETIPKGSIVHANGVLEAMENKEGKPYCEIKIRKLRTLERNYKDGSDPAKGKQAGGYSHKEFTAEAGDMPAQWL